MTADPRSLALEHVAWCLKEGMTLSELHAALGFEAGPHFASWEDAIVRLTRVASDMEITLDQRHRPHHRQASLPAPYRRREPPPAPWPGKRVCLCANLCRQDCLAPDRYCRFEARPSRKRIA
jgi:hypothetical protein